MVERRAFLKATVAANIFGIPFARALAAFTEPVEDGVQKIEQAKAAVDEETFWAVVRKQFLIQDGIYLNNGTMGPSPRMVLDAVIDSMIKIEKAFAGGHADVRKIKKDIAALIKANPEEIAITRNTTEGMSFIMNGLDFQAGDELLTTDQEHAGGICPMRLAAKRRRLSLRQLSIPRPPESKAYIVNLFKENITPKTKLIMISHLTFTNGVVFPVKELAQLAHDNGILLLVDGAHPIGMLDFDMHDLDCDYYASSSHKWLLAPKGTGILFLKEDMQERVWSTIASSLWDDHSARASRFDNFGTINHSLLIGLGKAVEFNKTIGQERIEKRIRSLISYFKEELRKIPKVIMRTPMEEDFSGGVASFDMEGVEGKDIYAILMREKKIRVRLVGEYGYGMVRVSTHIYNTKKEVDAALEILHGIAKGKLRA